MLGLYIGIYHVKYAVADTHSFKGRRLKFGVSWVDTTYRDFKKPVGSITVCDFVLLIYLKQHETAKLPILIKNFKFFWDFLLFWGYP